MKIWRALRPFGLRWGRLRGWLRVLKDNDIPAWRMGLAMARQLALAARTRARGEGPPRERLVANYRICVRCPFFEREFHRCILCGCFTPYKVATGGRCAAKEQDAASAFGYGA